MADQKGQPKKGGRNMSTSLARTMRYTAYKLHHDREKHKIKRILKSSMFPAAEVYAKEYALTGYLASIVRVQ